MKNFLIVYREEGEPVALQIAALLKKYKRSSRVLPRAALTEKAVSTVDCVIVVGGDGTLLRVSHFCGDVPVLGVNLTPETTEGFFMRARVDNFSECLHKLLEKQFELSGLLRLQATINGKNSKDGKKIAPCLNEYFVGSLKSYDVAEYELVLGKKKEMQKSSGVLISTPAGSHAWTKSAGGDVLPRTQEKIQVLVREPYAGRLTHPKLVHKILPLWKNVFINVFSEKMLLVSDSVSGEYSLTTGDIVEITASDEHFWLVEFT